MGSRLDPRADPGFQVRGGALKNLRRAEGGAKILELFRVKNHDFTSKNHIFSKSGGRSENFWGISCEKSQFYAKKSYFFQFKGGAHRVGPPWIRPCNRGAHRVAPWIHPCNWVKPKTIKLVFVASLLSTQHYAIKEIEQRLVGSESG